MSLESLANLGEFISSIAVLISLVYLAVQIKRSTEAERTSTYQSIVSDFGQMNQALASDPDLTFMYVSALEDFEALDASDRARISQVFFMTFRSFENMFYQHQKGYLEEEVWKGWQRLMLTYAARDGFQAWWRLRRDVFSEPFATFLDNEKIDRPIASYADVAGIPNESEPPAP